ncbi:MAG: hypothetical protein FWH28_07470 [Clostridiales bacterium]|nr:hypothetical protein [Clostridiales bacterium]
MAEGTNNRRLRRNRKRNQRFLMLTLLLVVSVFLAGGIYSFILYSLSSMAGLDMVNVVSWEHSVDGPAWSFQREFIIDTDRSCMLLPIVGEGERVSKGLEVARLNFEGEVRLNESGNRRLYSPMAGIVSYLPDGLEMIRESRDYQAMTIELLEERINRIENEQRESRGLTTLIQDKLTREKEESDSASAYAENLADAGVLPGIIEEAPSADDGLSAEEKTQPREVKAGAVVMKVTDNLSECYVYLRLPQQDEAPFLETDPVKLRLEEGGEGRGVVLECTEVANGWGVLFRLDSGLEALRLQRRHHLMVVLGVEEQLVVQAGAVVMKNGELGVYIEEKNRIRWKPVNLVGEKDGMQIIEGAAPEAIVQGDLVVTRPWLVWDGMRVRG